MQFNSVNFMIFFPLILFFYFIIPKKLRGILLLIASYFFYMSWNARYVILIASSTIVTYISGLIMSSISNSQNAGGFSKIQYGRLHRQDNMKKIIMGICIVINLAILFIFKYSNFLVQLLNAALNMFHVTLLQRNFDFLLPVGISFYTFQALGYIIDVYRDNIKAEKNFVKYALFVSFFPQLVAGPIERSKSLLPQIDNIENIRIWNAKRIASGAILMVWGFFMKMVIADRVSLLVDTVFNNYRMYGSTELILAVIGFTVQIYCDFGSYSVIAIGAAKIMGFELMENFNTPYFARSIKDFWNRWHISLSTWFKDYLYIPLGGNRGGVFL